MIQKNKIDTAVFGGKFDPPHLGHQLSIFLALEKYGFQEVWVIPSFSHPFGFHPGDFDTRLEMCRIMARPFGNRAKVLDIEIGSDNWNVRDKWKDFDKIEEMCREIVVIGRGKNEGSSFYLPDISSTMIKTIIKEGKNPENLLPSGIAEYIGKNKLYL